MTDTTERPGGIAGMAERLRNAVSPRRERNAGQALKTINLALQGGGAHGAFTWGVLDRLIEDGRLDFEAISGTSAGAMNAVVLADGFMRGGADGARERLREFWRGVSSDGLRRLDAEKSSGRCSSSGSCPPIPASPSSRISSTSPRPIRSTRSTSIRCGTSSSASSTSTRCAPMHALKLFISATNVRDGKIRVFSGEEVTADAVMASACLPWLFHAVEIKGEAYWDGGFTGNPALFPFFDGTGRRRHPAGAGQSRSAATRFPPPATRSWSG